VGVGGGTRMKIEIDADLGDQITLTKLEHDLKGLDLSYKQRKKNNKIMFFEQDRAKDLAEIKRHMDAFKLVISYYKVPV
jgi:hypothetical protein